jgi:hypothetical protein
MENQTIKPDAFGFAGGELANVVLGNLGLKCNQLSQFYSAGPAVASSSDDAEKAVNLPLFRRAAGILTNPQVRLSAIKGGSALPFEPFTVYACPGASGMEFAALLKPGDEALVLYFASDQSFLDWWLDLFACKSTSPIVNTLVPRLPVEEFTFVLHVLDTFRRIYMESMLLYHPLKECRILEEDFKASFAVALNSADVRWLLPAFFSLTPGLRGTLLDLQPGIVETAEMLHFISRTKNPDGGASDLLYGKPAMALGYEFATSWMFGLGLTVEVLNGVGTRLVAREFLAPTGLSNHLFTVEKGQAGLDMFTHLALTLEEYGSHMSALLQNAKAKALEPVSEPQALGQSSPQKPIATLPEVMPPVPVALPLSADVTLVSGSRFATSADIFTLTLMCEERRMTMGGQMHLGGAADNDLVLPGDKVAPHHALIQKQGLVYKIADLNSESGTFVNGKRISAPTLLKSGDIVLIGDSQLTISDQA